MFIVVSRNKFGYCDNKYDGLNFIKILRKIFLNGF